MEKKLKILVVRFSSIGDIVLTSPVVRCLKKQLDAEIHYLTKTAFGSLLEANPYIDRLHLMEREIDELIPSLWAERFDHIIDLHKNLRTFRLKRALRRPARSFYKRNFEKWLMVRFRIDRLPGGHIVDRYMKTVEPLGVHYDGQGLDHFISPEEEMEFPGPFVAFAIGAAHATKRLPREKILEICRGLQGPVLLLGGPSDMETGAYIAKETGSKVQNFCGRLKVQQSASLIRQAKAVITHDTGMMHIAAAFRKPIVSVWGNTIPAFGMYPFYPEGMDLNRTVQVEGLSCRPCSKIGFQECPKGHFYCMQRIDPEAVIGGIQSP